MSSSSHPPRDAPPADVGTPARRSRPRRPQQRSADTRAAILEAALEEFAEKGFEGASTHHISRRAGLNQPLIFYHFASKEDLWKAVAAHFFKEIIDYWDRAVPDPAAMPAVERVKLEFRLLFKFMLDHPRWHHFMLRENAPESPRLQWLADNYIGPSRDRIIDQIGEAQAEGELPQTNPFLLYYAVLGAATALTSLSGEMRVLTGFDPDQPGVADAFWTLIERALLA